MTSNFVINRKNCPVPIRQYQREKVKQLTLKKVTEGGLLDVVSETIDGHEIKGAKDQWKILLSDT